MSLINEALKKAQRQRNEDPAAAPATTPAGEPDAPAVRIPKRGKAPAANTMVLVGSGAIVLVVLSVAVTIYLVNRPSEPTPRVASAPATAPVNKAPAPSPETATPSIVAPAITAPALPSSTETASTPPPATTAAISTPAPSPAAPAPKVTETPPATKETAAPTPAVQTPPAAPGPDERIAAFVEAIRVTGIRSSGTDSRVLMNERVYRVNDIVDRTLSVRLIKVASDSLTFSDANGVTYEKHF